MERNIDEGLPAGVYEPLAVLTIARHGRLPRVGQEIRVLLEGDPADFAVVDEIAGDVLSLQVLAIERHVPSLVRVRVIPIERAHEDRAHSVDRVTNTSEENRPGAPGNGGAA